MSCLAGCISKYRCGDIKKAIDAEAIAPWVKITILGSGNYITVGNESAPQFNNTAVIASFQYGQTDGSGCRIEIVDEEGGAFQKFFDKILTDMKGAATKYKIEAEWGWVGSRCGSEGGRIVETSRKHHFLLTTVNIRFEQTMMFVLEGVDLINATTDSSRNSGTYGSDDSPIKLKDALRQMLARNNPPIKKVDFYRRTASGGVSTWEFKDDPKGKFVADQQNCLAVAQKWIRGYTTDGDKGVFIAWDDSSTDPAVIFWEDGQPKCGEIKNCGNSIGTYIVNGGECSPVISFNPTIKWPLAAIQRTGGSPGSRISAENLKQQDDDECEFEDEDSEGNASGLTTENIVPEHVQLNYGEQASKKFRLHDKRHGRANSPISHTGIEADLIIQGDPTLDDPLNLRFAYAAIVVIRPFHLQNGSGECPEWVPSGGKLASSTCDDIMSNSNWFVKGVSHEIRLGSYTTTLKVWLAPPGGTINRNLPLGGSSAGYKMPE